MILSKKSKRIHSSIKLITTLRRSPSSNHMPTAWEAPKIHPISHSIITSLEMQPKRKRELVDKLNSGTTLKLFENTIHSNYAILIVASTNTEIIVALLTQMVDRRSVIQRGSVKLI